MTTPMPTADRSLPLQARPPVLAVWCAGALIVSALSRPSEIGLQILGVAGLSGLAAAGLAHLIPVAVVALVAGAALAAIRVLPRSARPIPLVIAALVGGAGSAFLDLFARVTGLLDWAGPLRPATFADHAGWVLVFGAIIGGAVGLVLGAFGARGSQAIRTVGSAFDLAPADGPAETLPRRERRLAHWSGWSLIGLALTLTGVILAQASLEPDRSAEIGIVALIVVGAAIGLAASIWVWRALDEFERRAVIAAHAVSAIALTPALMVWAGLEGLGYAPPFTAYEGFLVVIALQLVLGLVITLQMAGTDPAERAV